jgi:hypothetical protein
MKLDKSRPYGYVSGKADYAYSQDGVNYMRDGSIAKNQTEAGKKIIADTAKQAKVIAAGKKALAKKTPVDDFMDEGDVQLP